MKRAALVAGVSIAALLGAGPTEVLALNSNPWWGWQSPADPAPSKPAPSRAHSRDADRKSAKAADQGPPPPTGVLHIIVSIDKQRATLFADGVPVASSAMSSGTPGHPTPMGLFTVIQKDRHHVSNLYDASMPYMQRITWSGSALHEGPLPGYPASHGCVRLTTSFAQMLWRTTKMGARVIITRPDVAPVDIEHPRLFVPKPKLAEATPTASIAMTEVKAASAAAAMAQSMTPEPAATAGLVKTADAANAVAVMAVIGDGTKAVATALVTEPSANTPAAEQPTKLPITVSADEPAAAPLAAAPVAEAEPVIASAPVEAAKAVETAPVEAKVVEAKPVEAKPVAAPAEIKSAEVPVAAKPVETKVEVKPVNTVAPIIVDERPKTMPATVVREANRRPISVFASLKEGKLYVRQGWKPLFTVPVSFEHPEQPIGTHVYTAMGAKADGSGLRWTVVSIPSSTKRAEVKVWDSRKSREHIRTTEVAAPVLSASAALDRLVMPQEAIERISELMMPGSSLIVSDNRLSDETGEYTDFIVTTQ